MNAPSPLTPEPKPEGIKNGRTPVDSRALASSYDAYYYAHGCGAPYERNERWLAFFGSIADRIVQDIHPAVVLDAGCAMGFLVEALQDRGVQAFGLDLSEYAIQNVRPDIRAFCSVGSVTDVFAQQYDLIVCIELFEHLAPREAERAIENICQHTEDVLFSSTPADYKEASHLNVQGPEHWAELFARHGFFRDIDYDASFITPWTARFRKTREPVGRVIAAYERHLWRLKQENQAQREAAIEQRNEQARQEHAVQTLMSQVAEKEQLLQARNNLLAEMQSGRGWRLLEVFRRVRLALAPRGSPRAR